MTGSKRAAKRTKYSGGVITIKAGIGDEQETFALHETLAKGSSPFFKAMLDKQWKENQFKEVKLPEDSPDIISSYVDWSYSGQIASKSTPDTVQTTHEEGRKERLHLAKLYVFGEKIQDDQFCDVLTAVTESIDHLVDGSRRFPGNKALAIIYHGTMQDSPIRRLLVDLYVKYGAKKWFTKDREEYIDTPEFLLDLTIALMQEKSSHKETDWKIFDQRKEYFKVK